MAFGRLRREFSIRDRTLDVVTKEYRLAGQQPSADSPGGATITGQSEPLPDT